MIQTENIEINGNTYTRTYSNAGMKIIRDGIMYDEAIDPADSGRVYEESSIPISPSDEATPEDYAAALSELGVSV
jgi:hypothetical protein